MDTKTAKALADVRSWARSSAHSKLYDHLNKTFDKKDPLKDVEPISFREILSRDPSSFYPEGDARFLVSAFSDDTTELVLIPQKMYEEWDSVQEAASESKSQVFIGSFPPLWQLGPYFFYNCREVQKTGAFVIPRNVPMIRQMILETGARVMVTTPEVAREVSALLKEHDEEHLVDHWILVKPLGVSTDIPKLWGEVIVEHHLEPGIIVGVSHEGGETFEASPYMYLEVIDGKLVATSLKRDAYPFIRVVIGRNARTHETSDRIQFSCERYE